MIFTENVDFDFSGGTLKIYGESLCRDVPYKTLLLSIRDCAQAVVREMLSKYGLDKADPLHYCLVQVNSDGTEYILDDDECPLSILMNHPTSRGKHEPTINLAANSSVETQSSQQQEFKQEDTS